MVVLVICNFEYILLFKFLCFVDSEVIRVKNYYYSRYFLVRLILPVTFIKCSLSKDLKGCPLNPKNRWKISHSILNGIQIQDWLIDWLINQSIKYKKTFYIYWTILKNSLSTSTRDRLLSVFSSKAPSVAIYFAKKKLWHVAKNCEKLV
jgi:hypothetical protein